MFPFRERSIQAMRFDPVCISEAEFLDLYPVIKGWVSHINVFRSMWE